MPSQIDRKYPQIKVCGLRNPQEAEGCARLGVDAIGCVFYPPSPRNVSAQQALAIGQVLSAHTRLIGVFVNHDFAQIMDIVQTAGLDGVQLHGQEAPDLVQRLKAADLITIKALFTHAQPDLDQAFAFQPTAFIAECGQGALPGGNARSWDWSAARELAGSHPLMLAGGLSPGNVAQAIRAAMPAAVDVSSGVEASPGSKDLERVAAFVEAVKQVELDKPSAYPAFNPIF
jgi:phosphoribosylanthranilate isomerase